MRFSLFVTTASAIDLDETRTVVADPAGDCVNSEQVKRGKRLFNATCGACHLGGITKRSKRWFRL
jgi:photosystem II cytochrome c550